MAAPVAFRVFTPEDSRSDLIRRIENAPTEHAEAILEGYELLQRLHDVGALAIANGMIDAGAMLTDKVTDAVSSKQAVTAMRVGLIFGDILTSLDPNRVQQMVDDAKRTTPSWFSLLRGALSCETRQALGLGIGLMKMAGEVIGQKAAERTDAAGKGTP
jgi:uncharacterized protein YjgD (DUF1641 family)